MRGARRAARRQRGQIGVDHRILQVGQGEVGLFRRARLGAREQQPVARGAGAARALDGDGRLPDAVGQAGRRRRVEPVAARQRFAGEGAAQRLGVLDEDPPAIGAVEAEGLEGGEIAARPDAELQPAVAHQVEHGGVLGHAQRQLQRQGDDAGAEPDLRGPRREMGQEDEGRGQAALVLVEVVLGDPGRVEAAALGMDDLFGRQAVALGRIGHVEQAGEEAEARRAVHVRHSRRSPAAPPR